MRVLWCMNVYSRLNHLRLQQSLLRRAFGNLIDISVFTNHETNGDQVPFLEDFLYHCPVNSGGHTGCRDAFNHGLTLAADYDVIVWSHADCVLSDYGVMHGVINDFALNPSIVFGCLSRFDGGPRRRSDHNDYALNDLTVWRSDFYRRVFPQHEDLDGCRADGSPNECVEAALGGWVKQSVRGDERVLVIKAEGQGFDGLARIAGTGAACFWNDDFDKTVEWLKERSPDQHAYAEGLGLTRKRLEDDRPSDQGRGRGGGLISLESDAEFLRSLPLQGKPVRGNSNSRTRKLQQP